MVPADVNLAVVRLGRGMVGLAKPRVVHNTILPVAYSATETECASRYMLIIKVVMHINHARPQAVKEGDLLDSIVVTVDLGGVHRHGYWEDGDMSTVQFFIVKSQHWFCRPTFAQRRHT